MSGMRWTTGIGIAVGGVGGAIAALMGAPQAAPPLPPVVQAAAEPAHAQPAPSPPSAAVSATPNPSAAVQPVTSSAETPAVTSTAASPTSLASATSPSALASAAGPSSPASSTASAAAAPPVAALAAPALDIPTTREGLLKAELLCDQKKDFDECARAAEALEKGTTGPADLEQAKRFRRIALTHLVAQCENASAHACFVLAAKYRAGTELAKKPSTAEALEKRGLELCRVGRSGPECPPR